MIQALACPACSATTLDVHDCESMMALGANTALFSLRCPTCGARISSIQPVPADMHSELHDAAVRVGAMGFLNAQ